GDAGRLDRERRLRSEVAQGLDDVRPEPEIRERRAVDLGGGDDLGLQALVDDVLSRLEPARRAGAGIPRRARPVVAARSLRTVGGTRGAAIVAGTVVAGTVVAPGTVIAIGAVIATRTLIPIR